MGELRELIILGNGPSRTQCNYHCETWGVNGGYSFAKRLDKLFMMDDLSQEVLEHEYDIQKLLFFDGSIVLAKYFPVFEGLNIPYEVFPIEECLEKFKTKFYCNTIAYMLAYALLYTTSRQGPNDPMPRVVDGYHKIWFYGIDMMSNTSYVQEKGGVEYWMGIALGMGIEVINTNDSATGKSWDGKMYGYYGLQEGEMLHEKLLAPWDMVKITKPEQIDFEWKREKDGINWTKVPISSPK